MHAQKITPVINGQKLKIWEQMLVFLKIQESSGVTACQIYMPHCGEHREVMHMQVRVKRIQVKLSQLCQRAQSFKACGP